MRRRATGTLVLLATIVFLTTPAPSTPRSASRAGPPARASERLSGAVGPESGSSRPAEAPISASPTAPTVTKNFEVLGHERLLKDEVHADVAVYDHGERFGTYAYIGSWSARCAGTGVNVINVNDPSNPKLVAIAGSHDGESHEDVVIRRIDGRDYLFVGVQQCDRGGRDGLDIFDVTDPGHPRHVSFFRTRSPFGGVHELDVVRRSDGRVLALLAVPFEEFSEVYFGAKQQGEFRIVDVTDPSKPEQLAGWGVIADSSLPIPSGTRPFSSSYQGLGNGPVIFAHSVRGADHGTTAYVSYWDAGFLKFDIGDPRSPRLVGRTLYPGTAEGDGHSLTTYDVAGDRYLLANDEDVDPTPIAAVTTSATGDTVYAGVQMFWARTSLYKAGDIEAEVFDAGEGCSQEAFEGADGKIALADSTDPFYRGIIEGWPRPPCSIARQAVFAAKAGAAAFVPNLVSPDNAYQYRSGPVRRARRVGEGMPVVQISDIDEIASSIRDQLKSGGSAQITLASEQPGVGFLRVYSESTARDVDGDGIPEFQQVGQFSDLPHVTGEVHPPPGDWEIHNTEVFGHRAYSSWYSSGIVAFDVSDPTQPSPVGQFVPPATSRFMGFFGASFPLVWGVAVDRETGIIYASDMRSGLWIVRPVGPAAARSA